MLVDSGTSIDLSVTGDTAVWTGALGGSSPPGNWTTAIQGSPKNWVLSSNPVLPAGATDYTFSAIKNIGDSVSFGDTYDGATAVGTGNVNIAENVNPAAMAFNNTAVNYTISSTGAFNIFGPGPLTKSGTGSLTLNTANTYSGGTTISGGTLNLGLSDASTTATASAIGTGQLSLGLNTTINNTSGGAVTLRTNNPQTWTGDFTFTGTDNLNMGTGAVTVIANATQATPQGGTAVTVAAKTLTVGGAITMPGTSNGLIKAGPGTLVLTGGGSIGTALAGANFASTSGQTRVVNGVLKIAGATPSTNLTLNGTRPSLAIGFFTGNQGSVIMTSGTLTLAEEMWLASNTGTYGSFTLQGGTVNEAGILAIARTFNDNGATPCGVGVMNISTGGTFNLTGGGDIAEGSYGSGGAASGALGLMNITAGGTLTTAGNNGILAGGGSYPGFFNVSGNGTTQGQVTVSSTSTGDGFTVGAGGTGAAGGSTTNLGAIGGTTTANGRITTPFVTGGNAANTSFNFHGGTLQANVTNNTNFMRTTNDANFRAYIWSEGAVVDTQAFNDTITQNLRAPVGSGVVAGANGVVTGLAIGGTNTGYADTPYVRVTNAAGDTTGTGATAVATIDYTTGAITNIVLTNPGVNYTLPPVFTLVGGGGTGAATITGTASLATNVGGGLTKIGTGRLALSGNNTYSGGTTLTAGTLAINSPTALGAATGALTINALGVSLDNTAAAPVTMTNANAQDWKFDFNWTGTRGLTMIGPVTLDGTAGSRTVTAGGTGVLTEAGVIGSGTATGFTKAGTGTIALSNTNTYGGATLISGGTLQLSGAGSIEASSGITVNGANARLLQTSTVPIVAHPVALTLGKVDGTTTIDTVNAASAAGAIVTHGNGTVTPITINNLTFAGAGTVSFLTSPTTAGTAKINVGALTTQGAAGAVIVKAANTNGYWSHGDTFQLLTYNTFSSSNGHTASASDFTATPANFVALGGRQTPVLHDDLAGHISVSITGDRVIWTGLGDNSGGNGNWITSPPAQTAKNWKLSDTAGNPATDYQLTSGVGDAVTFDDSAGAGHTTINISAANVSPASIIFNNTSSGQPYVIQTGTGVNAFGIAGISSVAMFNNGSLTLATPNTYTGGTFMNAGGTLVLNNATAIGTGALTMAIGGTLDNTSAGAITLTTNNLQTWNGDVNFTGTQSLNMGTGAVTIGGAGATRTINVVQNNLIVGPITDSLGLVKAGSGTLTINSNGVASTVAGDLDVTGLLQIALPASAAAANLTATGALSGSGTIENSSASVAANVIETNNVDKVFSGILQDGAGSAGGGRLGLIKNGSGKLTLSGPNTLSNGVTVSGGQLLLTGSIQPSAPAGNFGQVNVGVNADGSASGLNGIATLQNATLNAPKNVAPSVQVGGATGTAAAMNLDAGSTLTSGSELWLGTGDGGYGVLNTAGTITVNSWLALGRGGGQGLLNVTGGTVNVQNANNLTIGSFGGVGGNGVVHGQVNVSGGTLSTTAPCPRLLVNNQTAF